MLGVTLLTVSLFTTVDPLVCLALNGFALLIRQLEDIERAILRGAK